MCVACIEVHRSPGKTGPSFIGAMLSNELSKPNWGWNDRGVEVWVFHAWWEWFGLIWTCFHSSSLGLGGIVCFPSLYYGFGRFIEADRVERPEYALQYHETRPGFGLTVFPFRDAISRRTSETSRPKKHWRPTPTTL